MILVLSCWALEAQTNEWIWMGGSPVLPTNCSIANDCGQPGWYGTLGSASATNAPGGRWSAASWTDTEGNLWLFGGGGWDSAGNQGYLNDLWEFSPATAEWTWVSGSNKIPICTSADGCGQPGTYGTLGTPAATNVPGARQGAANWTDAKGDLWLLGGLGFDAKGTYGFLNDLWKFNTTSNEWTWTAGSNSVSCVACGPPGVYGTIKTPATGNIPGGRVNATTWTDGNSNFWLFGGIGEDENDVECYLNDMWEFNLSSNQWAWMGGDEQCSSVMGGYPGVYGTLGVPAAADFPWSLWLPTSWTDSTGHLWLFGGIGEDPTNTGYYLNDMWEFYPSLNEWAWTSANSVSAPGGSATGIYGTMGNFSAENIPGERYAAAGWTDAEHNFWLFGGNGIVSTLQPGTLNDLWEFKPSINEWAWIGGSQNFYQPGNYGALGTSAATDMPGARTAATTWTDSHGNLWLFGGSGYDAEATHGDLNDLWQFDLTGGRPAQPPPHAATPSFSPAGGTYNSAQLLTISDQTAGAAIYYTTNGTVPNSSSNVYSAPISVSTSEIIEALAAASGYSLSPVVSAAYTFNLPPTATPAFNVPGGTYTAVQIVAISDTTAGATIYYTTNGITPTTSSKVYRGPITVSDTETIEAIAVAPGFSTSAVESATYTINLPPNFALAASPSSLTVNSGSEGVATLTVTPQNGFSSAVSFACSGVPAEANCSFNPASVTPFGGNAGTTQLTITVSATSATASPSSERKRILFLRGTTLALAGVFLVLLRRRSFSRLLGLMIFVVGLVVISSCGSGGGASGGGGGGGGTQQTSTVMVTATSGSIQQTVTILLTVN